MKATRFLREAFLLCLLVMGARESVSAEKPLYMVIDLSGGTTATNYPVSYLADVPEGGWTDEYKTTKLVLRYIEPGSFTMGSPKSEWLFSEDEDQHQVTLTSGFWTGVFAVTQKQWELVMGTRPSFFTNDLYYAQRPVEQISYEMIRGSSSFDSVWPESLSVNTDTFVGELRAKTGEMFDLPTESQWEFACRAGTTTPLNNGLKVSLSSFEADADMDDMGRYWYNGGSNGYNLARCTVAAGTATVGSYQPNRWGLYDMHGNVREWCLDWYARYSLSSLVDPVGAQSGSYRVLRGGGWRSQASNCSSAKRGISTPSNKDSDTGFRLCCLSPSVNPVPEVKAIVEFDANGGDTKVDSRNVGYGNAVGVLPIASRSGYTFEGWYTESTNGERVTSATVVMGGRTHFYAHWSKEKLRILTITDVVAVPRYPWNGKVDISFTLNYTNAEDGVCVMLAALDVYGGTNLPVRTLAGDAVTNHVHLKAGRHVVTWNADEDASGILIPNMAFFVTARGPGFVRFDGGQGSADIEPIMITCWNNPIGELPEASRVGYEFIGWFTALNGGSQVTPLTIVTNEVTYYAHWEKLYRVNYDARGGRSEFDYSYVKSYVGTLPTATRSGYKFNGWFTAVSGGTQVTPSTLVTGDVTYYAHWYAPATSHATLDYNGGTYNGLKVETVSFSDDEKVRLSSYTPTREPMYTKTSPGWHFAGWTDSKATADNFTPTPLFENLLLSTSTVLRNGETYYAVWYYK